MSYISKHIKVVLFDHDDTLVATREVVWAAHKYIAKTYYGKNLSEDELRLHWGKPLSTLVSLLYGTDNVASALGHIIESHDDFPKVIHDDTLSTLTALKSSGKKIGLVTATSRRSLNHDFKAMQFPPKLFDYTQTEDESVYHKPDSRVFDPTIVWLKRHEIKPGEVVYVGDGLHDMKAALGAGFEFIGVSTGLVTQSEFKKHGRKAVNKLSDLID